MCNKAKHTPGPWDFKKIAVWAPTTPTDGIPFFEWGLSGGEEWVSKAKANARLIAASPDLLDACKGFAASGHLESCPAKLRDRVISAIAKAESQL